jgi:hypothetical protein
MKISGGATTDRAKKTIAEVDASQLGPIVGPAVVTKGPGRYPQAMLPPKADELTGLGMPVVLEEGPETAVALATYQSLYFCLWHRPGIGAGYWDRRESCRLFAGGRSRGC